MLLLCVWPVGLLPFVHSDASVNSSALTTLNVFGASPLTNTQVLLEDMVVVLHGDDFDFGIGSYERSACLYAYVRSVGLALLAHVCYAGVVLHGDDDSPDSTIRV